MSHLLGFLKTVMLPLILLVLAACSPAPQGPQLQPQALAIPHSENGYQQLHSQVIHNQRQLDRLLDRIKQQSNWNNQARFVQALQRTAIDFSQYQLVIFTHEEHSGAVNLSLSGHQQLDNLLVFTINREEPQFGTSDMAYYAWAWLVDKHFEQVDLYVGEARYSLKTKR